MDHMGKEMALVQQADKPSSVNLIYSLRWKTKSDYVTKIISCKTETNGKHSEEIGALAESLKIFQKYKVIII